MADRKRQPGGFSLVELLIVLAIMSILAGLLLPNADAGLHEELTSAARLLSGDIQYARSLAVMNGSNYRLTFDTVQNQYVLAYSGTNPALATLPPSPFHTSSDTPSQQVVRFADLPHVGPVVQIEAVFALGNTSTQVSDLEFGPLGETTRTGDTLIWLSAGTAAATRHLSLHVNAVTGLSSIESFQTLSPLTVTTPGH